MLPSRGYFSSISCPFLISGNCDRPHCHYRHCKTPTKEYDDEEPIPKRLFRIQATLSHEIKTHFEEEKIRTEKESQQNYGGIIPCHGPSGYPSNSSMPANNRPSNGDYYKRHIPVVYAPAKPTIVRRNSQYVPSVPQNCARPSHINYTPSSRPVSNPASEYKPQSLTSEFDSSVYYKPSQTIRHHADASSYTPRQTGTSDSSVSYTPSSTGKTNLDAYYTPCQTGKTYPLASYSPSPTLRTNSDSLYSPQGVTNVKASYSPTLSVSRNSDASFSTNSSVASYTPSIRTNTEASYSPSDVIRSSFDSTYSPVSSIGSSYAPSASDLGARLMDANYGQKVKNIVDAQTSPINSPKRANSLQDISAISSTKPKNTSLKDTSLLSSREQSPEMDNCASYISDDEMEEDEEEVMDSTDVNEMQVENVDNLEESKHSIEKKPSKEIPDKKKDILIEKAKKERRREHDKTLSKEKREEASDHSKKKSRSSSESKEKSSSHSYSKNKVTKEGKSKSDSKDSKTTECKEHKHSISSEKTKSSEKRIKLESSKDDKTKDGHTSKTDKKVGHSSKSDKKEGHSSSSSKNEKRKHSSSKDDKTKEADSSSKADKIKTNGHSKSSHGSHSKSSSKSSHHSKSDERNSHKDKNASSSEKPHKPTEKKHSSSSSSSSKHRHSSSKSESSRSKHSSSTKEKSKGSSSLKRSSSTEENLKIKRPKLEDHIIMEDDSDEDNQGQVICLDSEDDGCDDIGFSSNHKEEEVVRTTVEPSVENTSVDRWVKARETINRNSQGRVRIAHVPNVSSLLSAKEMIMSRNSNKRGNTYRSEPKEAEPSSDYVQPKVSKRVAHTPKVDDSLKYPTVRPHEEVKINLFTRQTCLRNLFEELVKHICQEDASKMALEEELEIAKRMNISKTYQNSVALLVLKIRKNRGPLEKNTGPVVEILSSNSIPSFTYGHTIYKCCLKYLVSDEELKRNGFPRRIKGRPGYANFDTTLSNRFPEKQEGSERVCINCNNSYMVDDDELPVMNNECVYHWGRVFKSKVGGNWIDYYSCCNRDMMMGGCEMAAFHLSNTFDWNALGGFVSTSSPPIYIPEDDAGVYALDCEMCHTTRGSELTRCTVIDLNGNIVYDAIVRPDHTILDYCTRFSGITEEIMSKSKTKLADVQARLLDLFNSKTILVGHSLENDLKALRIFHDRIIDTSILFPHKQGFPYKKALKTLTKEFLGREIQISDSGHDSKEDAVACLDLLMYKIKQDSKVRKPRVIISLPS